MSIENERRRLHGQDHHHGQQPDNQNETLLIKNIIEENKEIRHENTRLIERTLLLEKRLDQLRSNARKPILNLGIFLNNNFFIMADISLTLAGDNKNGIFVLTDNKTGAVISDAVLSNQAVGANSNPASATFALDANNNVVPTPLAVGSGTVVFSAHAKYNDLGDQSAQEGDFSVTKAFTVKTAPDGASLDVQFS